MSYTFEEIFNGTILIGLCVSTFLYISINLLNYLLS